MDNIGIPFFNRIAQRIANMRPIPARTKQALVKTMQKGKPLPAPIKKALAKRSMVRQSMPAANIYSQSMPAANIVRQAMATNNNFFKRLQKLTKITNPSIVQNVSPIQRSFMPVDLPYETMSKKSYAMKIPATNFAMPTNIDLVQPPVDNGTSNYYGK
jgi:hypothetical protein